MGVHPTVSNLACVVALFLLTLFWSLPAHCGAPFRTDDPQPADYRHWELLTAADYQNDKGNLSGTTPQIELNYGVAANLQLHIVVPHSYERPKREPSHFGLGDIELGIVYRFIQESKIMPMVGTFPLVVIPTGSRSRGLGTGKSRLFIPIWLQKSWKPWTTYGGGGYWINPGTGNKDYWYTGWVLERQVAKWLSVGAELFHITRTSKERPNETGYNIGVTLNFSEKHHLIGSAGTDIHGPANFFCYMAFVVTWGPP